MNINNIYPNNLNIKHNYIKVNNTFVATIIIEQLPKSIGMFEIINIIPKDLENIISIYIKKLDRMIELKKMSKIILETNAELKTINNNQQSSDILRQINKDATELRKQIQLENEDIYKINIYICIKDLDYTNLNININKIISNLYARGIFGKVANFRHDQIYLDTLPINNSNEIIKQTGITLTSTQLAYMIPYVNNNIYDLKGILFGYINNAFCIYDIFSKNNMNHNMCILGSSGAGKSYFVKTIILRNFCMNIRQVIFDIEQEYLNISNNTNTIIFDENNFNYLYIPEAYVINNSNFLENKINDVYITVNDVLEDELSVYENTFKNSLKNLYKEYKIVNARDSMYSYYDSGKIKLDKEYRKYSEFPSFKNLVDILDKNNDLPQNIVKKLKNLKIYKKYDNKKAKLLNNQYDTIIVFNIKELDKDIFSIYLNYTYQYYDEKLLMYIDEMWKFVNLLKNSNIDAKIAELFKTIRKRKAGIIVISQDINDILKYKEGAFGKSILNNSFTKLFFKMQYMDLSILQEIGIYSKEAFDNIKKLVIGKAYMNIGDIKFNIDIKASKAEEEIIGGVLN